MSKLLYEIIKKRDKILEIAKKWGVENVRVFGSVASGTERARSDIDFLVDVVRKPDGTMGSYIEFSLAMSKLFGTRKVECCASNNILPRIKKNILENSISIMEDNPKLLKKTKRDYLANIEKILENIKNFWEIIKNNSKKSFLKNRTVRNDIKVEMQDAIEETVRFIPMSLKKRVVPEVDWIKLKNFRNLIVHNYDLMNSEDMWNVSQEKIKELEKGIVKLNKFLKEKEGKKKN